MGRTLIRCAMGMSLVVFTLPATAIASNVATWGPNEYGQLGDGKNAEEEAFSDSAVAVSGAKEAVEVASGCYHKLARLANGTVVAWGADWWGQLGDGIENPIQRHAGAGPEPLARARDRRRV